MNYSRIYSNKWSLTCTFCRSCGLREKLLTLVRFGKKVVLSFRSLAIAKAQMLLLSSICSKTLHWTHFYKISTHLQSLLNQSKYRHEKKKMLQGYKCRGWFFTYQMFQPLVIDYSCLFTLVSLRKTQRKLSPVQHTT